MQILPGVSHATGGWRIAIRACIGLRSGKVVQRGAYGARIGDGPEPENNGFREVVFNGVYGVSSGNSGAGFFVAGPGNFSVNFSKKFFGAGNNLGKILCGPDKFIFFNEGQEGHENIFMKTNF